MKRILLHPASRVLCWYLSLFFAGCFALPSVVQASFIPAPGTAQTAAAGEDLAVLRAALENEVLAEKLASLGLSPREVSDRLAALTAEERREAMADLQSIQSGGFIDSLIGLAVLVLIIIVIVKLVNKEIVVK